jgi:Tol biopolymer transport system component
MKSRLTLLFMHLLMNVILASCGPSQAEFDDLASQTAEAPTGTHAWSVEETNVVMSTDTPPSPTIDPLAGISIQLQNLGDSDFVPPRMILHGTYAGLEPNKTSIHVLVQPLTAGDGRVFPSEEFFTVPEATGEWAIPVLFGEDESLSMAEQYNVWLAFTSSEDVRMELAEGMEQGFVLLDLPHEVIVLREVIHVERQPYVHVQEYRLLYNSIYLHGDVKSMDIVSISIADRDDRDLRRLTNTTVSEVQPSLCPGNQKIAFVQIRGHHVEENPNWAIWIMDSDGQNMEVITDEPDIMYDKPAWSVDCRFIAYAAMDRETEPARWFIYLLDYQDISREPIMLARGRYPSWVPGGSALELVFEHAGALYRLNVDTCFEIAHDAPGTCEAEPLTGTRFEGTHPSISPDGQWLAFASIPILDESRGIYIQDIYVYNLLQGGDSVRLAENPNLEWRPVWGQDSQTIYFESGRTLFFSIFVISLDGSGLQLLTDPSVEDQNPHVAFQDAYFPIDVEASGE